MTDSPLCPCGNLENAYHYLLICPLYIRHRNALHDISAQHHIDLTLNLLLFGDVSLSVETNTRIFESVQKYILDTKRF